MDKDNNEILLSSSNRQQNIHPTTFLGTGLFRVGMNPDPKPALYLSLDRLTVIADYDTRKFDYNYFEWLREPFMREAGDGLQIVEESKFADVPPEQVAYIEKPKFLENKIRIDFNPNHGLDSEGGAWLVKFLSKLPNKHYSRCDIAFDIVNIPEVENYRVWQFGSKKRVYYGRGGAFETGYYGSSSSGKQIRFYNKKIEQKERHKKVVNHVSWWRLELQLRGKTIDKYPDVVRKMLESFYIPAYELEENQQTSNKLFRLQHDPDYYGKLSNSAKAKTRALLKKCNKHNRVALALADLFVKQFDRLEDEIYSTLNKFDIDAEEIIIL